MRKTLLSHPHTKTATARTFNFYLPIMQPVTIYTNLTMADAIVRTQSGQKINVPKGSQVTTTIENPFTHVKFPGFTGFRKL